MDGIIQNHLHILFSAFGMAAEFVWENGDMNVGGNGQEGRISRENLKRRPSAR